MATNDTVIRAPVNTAGQTSQFIVDDKPVTVYLYPAASLTATEYADLQRDTAAGTFQDVYDHSFKGSGGQVRLDTTVTDITIEAPGTYRLDFDNPTNAVGAAIMVPTHKR